VLTRVLPIQSTDSESQIIFISHALENHASGWIFLSGWSFQRKLSLVGGDINY
jgi:hypothetical protein